MVREYTIGTDRQINSVICATKTMTQDNERTDVATVREGDEDHTVVSVRDTFGEHSSAALEDDQVDELIRELGGTPNDDLRKLIYKWREHHGVDGRTAMIYETCADELERLIDENTRD